MMIEQSHPIGPTIVDVLRQRAQSQARQCAYTMLIDGSTVGSTITYGQLDQQARAVAAMLQARGLAGERALLLFPTGLDFLVAFFGCLYAQVVAIPAPPPTPTQLKRALVRLAAIVSDAQPRIVLTTSTLYESLAEKLPAMPDLAGIDWWSIDTLPAQLAEEWQPHAPISSQLAYLQYTSGSTTAPRGVMVGHTNLVHNLSSLAEGYNYTAESIALTWLPNFHDFGLVDGLIQPLYQGIPAFVMSPRSFIQRPARWLQAISRYRATHSSGPNFAYELCVRKATPAQLEGLDLSCWRVAGNGAEPVRRTTLERFAAMFAPYGFRREALYPSYGLAEATLAVAAGGRRWHAPIYRALEPAALEQHRVRFMPGDTNARVLVGCGVPMPGMRALIVHPEHRTPCAPDEIGEIWIAGPSVAQGYWQRPGESAATFGGRLAGSDTGPFLRTGDLGFLSDGELFITGRLKDLIIIRGQNHYPQDIEWTVQQSDPSFRADGCAAFTIERAGEERLIIVQEVERQQREPDIAALATTIRRAIAEQHDLEVETVVLIRAGSLPKTSSGKVRRNACRAQFLEGSLDIIGQVVGQPAPPQPPAAPVAAPAIDGVATLRAWLIERLAAQLEVAPEQIDPRAPFAGYGLDSLAMTRLTGELAEWLARDLAPTLAYDYPTIDALAGYLAGTALEPAAPARAASRHSDEPIAIIGMGCRFPGADHPQAFWSLLRAGLDATGAVPAGRWPATSPDTSPVAARRGGFLQQIDQFDPQFFGITPREAMHIDPQQRLLLEVAWEALEHAGLAPEQLVGSQTGVFVGIATNEYQRLLLDDPDMITAYAGTGAALSLAANRISYTLDLHGPSVAIDTACSSSLVAVHLACQSLRSGESSLALAGGVSLMVAPDLSIAFTQARMLAADGRCKTFDAAADGYGRGEGCGVVVLKGLSDALRDGDPILALVCGSAINQDGRSNGITAPNGLAQRRVIQQALEQARISPAQVGYVEAHGTGTPLGDPIETAALAAVLGPGRAADQPCVISSVKTNIGHLEAAAGIAGLIKTVLALQHEQIPAHLLQSELNPLLGLEHAGLVVGTAPQPWRRSEQRRYAGVSSFGFGGTNAHAVLCDAPALQKPAGTCARPLQILTLAAKSPAALRTLAARWASYLELSEKGEFEGASPSRTPFHHGSHEVQRPFQTVSDSTLADICFTANTGRSHFAHRLAVVAATSAQARERLTAFAHGEPGDGLLQGYAPSGKQPKVAFLFSGQGSQYAGMGRQLYQTQPAFRAALDRCAALLEAALDRPLLDLLFAEPQAQPGDDPINQTRYTQPALFALEYALAELWRSWGVVPSAVLGHSIGEYVAACVAGVLSLEDALSLVAARGRLMHERCSPGAMLAVFAPPQQVQAVLAAYNGQVTIAAINGPMHVVVAGAAEPIAALRESLHAHAIETRPLMVSHAFHSPLMNPLLDDFEQLAGTHQFASPQIALVSNLTGACFEPGQIPNAQYWRQHLREPVQFMAGIQALAAQGIDIFIELGPRPTLIELGRRCLPDRDASWLPSLKAGQDDWAVLLNSLAVLYTHGVPIDWAAFDRESGRQRLHGPAYPFERARYWIDRAPQPAHTPSTEPSGNGAHDAGQAQLIHYYRSLTQGFAQTSELLHFAPFPSIVPGFSWLATALAPEQHPEHTRRTAQAHAEMRQALLRGLDLAALNQVLDIGCGSAADIIALAQSYPHLRAHGCNISPDQIALGNQRIHAAGLADRVRLYLHDSSREPFPGRYNLVFSSQVLHHITDKAGAFANISAHLENGGFLVMAEMISNLESPIEHQQSSAYYLPRSAWAELLAQHRLCIVEGVDASAEIGNYLYDPSFEAALDQLCPADPVTRDHLRGPHLLGELLRRNLVIYGLLTVQKDTYRLPAVLHEINRARIAALTPYAAVRNTPGIAAHHAARAADTAPEPLNVPLHSIAAPLRKERITRYLCEQVALVAGLAAGQVDSDRSLPVIGLDSLMALDLKRRIERDLGLDVAIASLFHDQTIGQLAQQLLAGVEQQIDGRAQPAEPGYQNGASDPAQPDGSPFSHSDAERLLAQLDQLSETEVQSLLERMLGTEESQ